MTRREDLSKVVEFVRTLMPLFGNIDRECSYSHMGAVIADSSLQAGINYDTVVRPRIHRILSDYGHWHTTSALSKLLESIGVAKFLNWQHEEKIERFNGLFGVIVKNEIETTEDLHHHLSAPKFIAELTVVRGVGPKTIDYIKMLCGHPNIAIDRHLKRAVEMAGVKTKDYAEIQSLLMEASEFLGISPSQLDWELWKAMRSI